MTSYLPPDDNVSKSLWLLRDFAPEYHHAKFGCNWKTNKLETEGGTMCPPPSLYGSKRPKPEYKVKMKYNSRTDGVFQNTVRHIK